MDQNEESDDENSILPFLINPLVEDRGQTQIGKIAYLSNRKLQIYSKKELVNVQQIFQK